jgi:hypothetical protein
MKTAPPVGSRVRLTGKFLRSTGQYTGQEGLSRWTVMAHPGCKMCERGQFVAVDEPSSSLPREPRHINIFNLERCPS